MGISERKERQKTELRATILAAARRIFAEDGAQALTMRRIAEAIEYSPATLYLYFSSREEIALLLVREGFEKLSAALGSAPPAADPVERLQVLSRAYIAFGLGDPETYRLIFMADAKFVYSVLAPTGGAPEDDPGRQAFDLLAGTIREAVDAGRFKPVDPERAADGLWAALHGVLSLAITCPKMIADPTSTGAFVAQTLIAGMRV